MLLKLEHPALTVPCRPETMLLLLERYGDTPHQVITETLEIEQWVWRLGPCPLPLARSLHMTAGPLVGSVAECVGRVQADGATQVRLTLHWPPGSLRAAWGRREVGRRCLRELAADLEELLRPPYTLRAAPRARLPGKVTLSLGIHQYLGELADASAFGVGVILPLRSAGVELLLPSQPIQVTIRRLGWTTIETTMTVAHLTNKTTYWFVGLRASEEIPGLALDLRRA